MFSHLICISKWITLAGMFLNVLIYQLCLTMRFIMKYNLACGCRWDPTTKRWNKSSCDCIDTCMLHSGLHLLIVVTIYLCLQNVTSSVRAYPWIFLIINHLNNSSTRAHNLTKCTTTIYYKQLSLLIFCEHCISMNQHVFNILNLFVLFLIVCFVCFVLRLSALIVL